ncbi:hypothetical protein C882_3381 [Caenispirillum salinarum AK4]|uniref:Uncharacterized protein n=1 Tax=Caenispirillum salinarum AK4 TaxID=1238182 RepID=K9GMJ6_9PROT|nr:hypothetical protein C882_3381 [Caenispirillum salinarum AK4]
MPQAAARRSGDVTSHRELPHPLSLSPAWAPGLVSFIHSGVVTSPHRPACCRA